MGGWGHHGLMLLEAMLEFGQVLGQVWMDGYVSRVLLFSSGALLFFNCGIFCCMATSQSLTRSLLITQFLMPLPCSNWNYPAALIVEALLLSRG